MSEPPDSGDFIDSVLIALLPLIILAVFVLIHD